MFGYFLTKVGPENREAVMALLKHENIKHEERGDLIVFYEPCYQSLIDKISEYGKIKAFLVE